MENLSRKKKAANNLYIFLCAVSIGWMTGIALTHVVQTIISSVLAIVVGAVSLLAGLQIADSASEQKPSILERISYINLWPVALLSLGLIIGEIPGILMRTHNILGTPVSITVRDSVNSASTKSPFDSKLGVLYKMDADQRGYILACDGQKLLRALQDLDDPIVNSLLEKCQGDSLCLEHVKYIVCIQPK